MLPNTRLNLPYERPSIGDELSGPLPPHSHARMYGRCRLPHPQRHRPETIHTAIPPALGIGLGSAMRTLYQCEPTLIDLNLTPLLCHS